MPLPHAVICDKYVALSSVNTICSAACFFPYFVYDN